MKIERQGGTFSPIVITLESVNEALAVAEALRTYRCARRKDGFFAGGETPKDNITTQLLSYLSEIGY